MPILFRYSNLLFYLIFILAFTSAAPTDPSARAGLEDAGFNIFRRYIGGIVSLWDFLFLGLLLITILRSFAISKKKHRGLNQLYGDKILNSYFVLLITSVSIGLFIILATQIAAFDPIGWFRAVTPVLYMLGIFYIVVNTISTEEHIDKMWCLLELLAGMMIIYGFLRLYNILAGNVTTLIVEGVPIILYSELSYFDLPILVYVLRLWCGKSLGAVRWIMLICMIGFILASTRRYNYIQLILNCFIGATIASQAGMLTLQSILSKSKISFAILFCILVSVLILLPDFAEAVLFSIRTINVFSEEGYSYTGEFRIAQFNNILLNIAEVPITFFTGFGIGTQWRVIEPLPTTIDEIGSFMAYDSKIMSQYNGYLPYFHILYFASIFRFGVIGFALLIFIAYRYTSNAIKLVKATRDLNMKILAVGLASLSVLPMISLGDNAAVTTWINLGVNLALIRSICLLKPNNKKPTYTS